MTGREDVLFLIVGYQPFIILPVDTFLRLHVTSFLSWKSQKYS